MMDHNNNSPGVHHLSDGLVSFGNALPSRDEFLDDDMRRASNFSSMTDAYREEHTDDDTSSTHKQNSKTNRSGGQRSKGMSQRGPKSPATQPLYSIGDGSPAMTIAVPDGDAHQINSGHDHHHAPTKDGGVSSSSKKKKKDRTTIVDEKMAEDIETLKNRMATLELSIEKQSAQANERHDAMMSVLERLSKEATNLAQGQNYVQQQVTHNNNNAMAASLVSTQSATLSAQPSAAFPTFASQQSASFPAPTTVDSDPHANSGGSTANLGATQKVVKRRTRGELIDNTSFASTTGGQMKSGNSNLSASPLGAGAANPLGGFNSTASFRKTKRWGPSPPSPSNKDGGGMVENNSFERSFERSMGRDQLGDALGVPEPEKLCGTSRSANTERRSSFGAGNAAAALTNPLHPPTTGAIHGPPPSHLRNSSFGHEVEDRDELIPLPGTGSHPAIAEGGDAFNSEQSHHPIINVTEGDEFDSTTTKGGESKNKQSTNSSDSNDNTKLDAGVTSGDELMSSTMSPRAGDGRRRKKLKRGDEMKQERTILHKIFLTETLRSDHWLVNLADFIFLITTIATLLLIIASIHPKNEYVSLGAGDSLWEQMKGNNGSVHGGALAWYGFLFIFTLFWTYLRPAILVQKTQWDVVDDVADIWKEYRRFWLWVDLAFLIPFEFFFISRPVAFYYATTHHFVRYFRVLSLSRTTNPLMKQRMWYTFLTYCFSLFLFYDIVANIFWSLEDNAPNFIDAVYWAIVTMTSVGYGDVDVTPKLSNRAFTCFSCISGSLLMASLTALATRFVTQRDILEEELDRKKKMMHSMLNYYQIPWNVQKEVISLFPAVLDAQSESNFKSMIEQLPVFVADKIESYLRAKILANVPLFQGLTDPEVILRLSEKLEQRFVPPFQHIVTAGELGQEMFFLVRGIVEVIVPVSEEEDRVVATLRSGSFFGEIALIESTHRSATVQAMTGCELLVLAKIHFDSVVYHSAQLQDRLEVEVLKRKKINDEIAPEANFNFPPTPDGSESVNSNTMVRPHIPVPTGFELPTPTGGPTSTEPARVSEQRADDSINDMNNEDDDGDDTPNTGMLMPTTDVGDDNEHSLVSSNEQSFADISIQAVRHGKGNDEDRRFSITQRIAERKKIATEARLREAALLKRQQQSGSSPHAVDRSDSPAFFSVGDLIAGAPSESEEDF